VRAALLADFVQKALTFQGFGGNLTYTPTPLWIFIYGYQLTRLPGYISELFRRRTGIRTRGKVIVLNGQSQGASGNAWNGSFGLK